MKQLTAKGPGHFSGIGQAVTEMSLSHADHAGCDRIRNSPNVRFAVADKNGGLMAKLRESFFNYLRNRCL